MIKRSGKKLGLIVNPVAGIGGKVGLKGSDGLEIQKKARELGAEPQSLNRALQSLRMLAPMKEDLELITCPAEMGDDAARECGFQPTIVGSIIPGATTAGDTQNAVSEMAGLGVDLLLFAGGDGTARDVYNAVEDRVPVLGVPAGVKIHSAVFGTSPRSAGGLALLYLQGRVSRLREAEVMDVDEEAFRRGILSAKLYGYLRVPLRASMVQSAKAAAGGGAEMALNGIARAVAETMDGGCLYVFGPGTTTRAITSHLGLDKTLLGVDVVLDGELIAADVNESQLLRLMERREARIIVTPIGGQGYIFGRGNQQLSPRVIDRVGRDGVIVVSTCEKINALGGRPLLVDTGDQAVDALLGGYVRVITGYNEQTVYRVSG